MRPPAVLLALVVVLLTSPLASAQTAAPPQTVPSTGTLMRLTLDELPSDHIGAIGIIRTTYDVGGSLRTVTGSGPEIHFVEAGTLSMHAIDGVQQPAIARAGASGESTTPQSAESDGEAVLEAGDAFVLPPGATAELRNAGTTPAVVLDLLAATDGSTDAEAGVTHAVLVRREAPLPEPPVVVTLDLATIAPSDRFSVASAPTLTVFATVERSQSFLLSGEGINRGARPMEIYVLEIAPGTAPAAATATSDPP